MLLAKLGSRMCRKEDSRHAPKKRPKAESTDFCGFDPAGMKMRPRNPLIRHHLQ
jgi:hypothetical protein